MGWGANDLLMIPAYFVVAGVMLVSFILFVRDIILFFLRRPPRPKSSRPEARVGNAIKKSRPVSRPLPSAQPVVVLMKTACFVMVILVVSLYLFGCADTENAGDDDDDNDDATDDDTTVEGEPCPHGPTQCEWTEGCHDGYCGSCVTGADCRDMQGCLADGICGTCTQADQCAQGHSCLYGYCMPDEVPQWELTIDQADWDTMMSDIWAETYFPCTLTAGGVTYDQNVEVRLYGFSARTFPKKSFRIRFPEDVDHPGFARKINLKADYVDPAMMRSTLGFEAFRRMTDVPSPRTRHIRLNINGSHYGLMTQIERVGGKFLEARGRDRDNAMYEAEENIQGSFVPPDNEADYLELFSKKTEEDKDYDDLIYFNEMEIWQDYLDSGTEGPTSTTRIRQAVNIPMKIDYLAVMTIIQNIDHVAGNYHFSWQEGQTKSKQWEFYPWDLDITFGCFYDDDTHTVLCDDPQYDEWWGAGMIPEGVMAGEPDELWVNVLIHLIFKDPELQAQYMDRVCELLDSSFWTQDLPNLVEAIGDTIADAVVADTNDQTETLEDFLLAKDNILQFLNERKTFLKQDLGCS